MKTIFKSIDVAFSIYSKIPMPRFEWNSSDMKYHLCFFPWVGAVIGGLEWLWYLAVRQYEIGPLLFLLFATAIPLLVTGGFHVDGFMDTMDAIHSYQKREKKLEILKDPHIGAFSVICLVIYGLLFVGFLSEVATMNFYGVFCCSFFISRTLSGISVICFPSAKKEGMLQTSSMTAEKKRVFVSLIIQLVLGMAVMLYLSIWAAVVIAAVSCCFLYYYKMSKKEFGGITGDLAGFFVTISELVAVITLGILSIMI